MGLVLRGLVVLKDLLLVTVVVLLVGGLGFDLLFGHEEWQTLSIYRKKLEI